MCLCVLVTRVSPAESDEPIEMPFRVAQETVHWMGVQIPHGNGQFRGGMGRPIVRYSIETIWLRTTDH